MRSLVAISVLLLLSSCGEPPEKPSVVRLVRVMKAEQPVSQRVQTFPGRTRASDRTNLSFRVSGPLVELPVDVGSTVKEGDLLAQIDPKDFQVRLAQTQGQLERTKADLRFAKSDYKRALSVREQDPGAISASIVDKKEETVNKLEGEVKALEAEVQGAQDSLDYATLTAPYTGIIVARYVENYEYVNAKKSVLRMLNTQRTEMTVDLPQQMVSALDRLISVCVSFDGFPDKCFPATIKELGVEASSTTRTYPATLLIENIEESILLAGMAGEAEFTFAVPPDSSQSGIEVASGCVFTDANMDKSFVWLVQEPDKTLNKKEVQTGRMTRRGILVTEGIEPGQWVVTAGVHSVNQDQKVRLLPITLDENGRQLEQWAEE